VSWHIAYASIYTNLYPGQGPESDSADSNAPVPRADQIRAALRSRAHGVAVEKITAPQAQEVL
jgi:hypothetical protein